ncbi:hypothetical protein OBV_36770 [Oscillibacter valericigenes Sjm18-20]|nr:hypothetical protein OBV_36770 [Oscillibacter valericigenes Sjm18-20]
MLFAKGCSAVLTAALTALTAVSPGEETKWNQEDTCRKRGGYRLDAADENEEGRTMKNYP